MAAVPLAISYIRFSTLEQKEGNSFKRQHDLTKAFCEEKGWRLSDQIYLDEGISAFRGKNKKEGKLGALVAAMREGKIPKGTFLVVESLDRMSREDIRSQVRLFLEILDLGINIVTLIDGTIHLAESSEDAFPKMMLAIVTMFRANEESVSKSRRLSEAWKAKRENGADKPLTNVLPAWLKQEGGKIVLIPERAKIIEEIFRDSASGMGRRSIAQKFNARSEPVWGSIRRNKHGLWNDSYVAKILMNRAVLGEYQPHTKKEGKRIIEGNPWVGYFPRVIEDQLFYACQGKAKARKGKGGFAAPKARNLFNAIARCAVCGGKTQYTDKGPPRVSVQNPTKKQTATIHDQYLQCRAAHLRAKTCSAPPVNYTIVERFMIEVMMTGRWESLFSASDNSENSDEAILAKQAQAAQLKEENEKLLNAMAKVGSGEIVVVMQRVSANESRATELLAEAEGLKERAAMNRSRWSAYNEAVLAKVVGNSRDNLEKRRQIKAIFEDMIDAVYIEKRGIASASLFVVLKSGKIVIGHEEGPRRSTKRSEIALAPWQLHSGGSRVAIDYEVKNDREGNPHPYPLERLLPKGRDLIRENFSGDAATNLSTQFVPESVPNFKSLNVAERAILKNQQEAFDALLPASVEYNYNDAQALPKAFFVGGSGLVPFNERERIEDVEQNFRGRLEARKSSPLPL